MDCFYLHLLDVSYLVKIEKMFTSTYGPLDPPRQTLEN